MQNGRGTALADIMYSGRLGIIIATGTATTAHMCQCRTAFWILLRMNSEPSLVRTVISADFDNDGYDKVFLTI